MYCIYCGKEVSDNARFCPHCGKAVDGTDIVNIGNAKKKDNAKNILIFAIIAVLAVLVCIIICVLVLPRVSDNDVAVISEKEQVQPEEKTATSDDVSEEKTEKTDPSISEKTIEENKADEANTAKKADSQKEISETDKACKAYYELVKKLYNDGNGGDDPIESYDKFKLIYINDDEIPELLAAVENDVVIAQAIYTYYNDEVVLLGEYSYGYAGTHDDASYISKSGKVRESGYSGGTGDIWDTIYELKNGRLVKIAEGEGSLATEEYKWNGSSVSEDTYTAELMRIFNSQKGKLFSEVKTISYRKIRKKLKNNDSEEKSSGDNTVKKTKYYYFEGSNDSEYAKIKKGKLIVYGKLKQCKGLDETSDFTKTLARKKRTYKLKKGYKLDYMEVGGYYDITVSQFNAAFSSNIGSFCFKVDKTGKVSHIRCFS